MESKAQRLVFGETLVEIGKEDDRVVVLDADVCSSTQTKHFGAAFPERFYNVGIAEANMLSTAAGLASCGLIPFVSTFALFIALRASDQLRGQIAYTKLPVKFAGGYAGLSDFADGASHQAIEDIAVMRAIPNITILSPSDIVETREAVKAAVEIDGPVYIRLSREAVTKENKDNYKFKVGKGITLRKGDDLTIVCTGQTVKMANEAAEKLAEKNGIEARVINMPTIKPIDQNLLVKAAKETNVIVTMEEHNIYGGLGSAVAEAVAEKYPVPVLRGGVGDHFGESGTYPEILARAGVDSKTIIKLAKKAMTLKDKMKEEYKTLSKAKPKPKKKPAKKAAAKTTKKKTAKKAVKKSTAKKSSKKK